MATLASILCLVFGISVVFAREPVVSCPVPLSPEHGQSFLFSDGQVVKIVCESGYLLLGKEIVRCIDGQWEEPFPTCVDVSGDEEEEGDDLTTPPISTSERPLFNWGGNEDEVPVLGDEAKLRRAIYPRRMLLPARVSRRPSSDLDEEAKKRSAGKTAASKWTTMTLEPPAPLVYVRRTVSPGKTQQERTLNEQYRTASVHMTVDSTDRGKENAAQQATLSRAAVSQQPQNDKGDDTLRHNYWLAQHYYYNRQPSSTPSSSVMEYRTADPRVVTLTESQMAWINSLHPELRDQYLRDLYVLRADEAAEGVRSQAFLRRYGDPWYRYPYYLREPVAVVTEDLITIYDYSCNQAGHHFVTAPRLANAHIARYDRRQNPNPPNQHYLAAIYKCNPGYVLYDARNTELVCSRRNWIGTQPICVRRG